MLTIPDHNTNHILYYNLYYYYNNTLLTIYIIFTYIHSKQGGPLIILMLKEVQEVHENKVLRDQQSHNLYSLQNLQDLLEGFGKCVKRWKYS